MSAMKQPRNEWDGMVRHLSVEEFAAELRERLADYERRHGCSSAEKLASLGGGRYDESAEVAFWMHDYQDLLMLEAESGPQIGSPTTVT